MNKTGARSAIFYIIGLLSSVVPVSVAILSYFPVWRAKGGECLVSGLTLCLMLLAAVPLFKSVKRLLRSPSAYLLWGLLFALFFTLSKIGEEMVVISFVGAVSNLFGAVMFRLSGRRRNGKGQA